MQFVFLELESEGPHPSSHEQRHSSKRTLLGHMPICGVSFPAQKWRIAPDAMTTGVCTESTLCYLQYCATCCNRFLHRNWKQQRWMSNLSLAACIGCNLALWITCSVSMPHIFVLDSPWQSLHIRMSWTTSDASPSSWASYSIWVKENKWTAGTSTSSNGNPSKRPRTASLYYSELAGLSQSSIDNA